MTQSFQVTQDEGFEITDTERPKPGRLVKKLNQWFPVTHCWGYRARRIGPKWLFGKVERPDRAIFKHFITLWARKDFAWGIYCDYETEEFSQIICPALFHNDSPSEEEINKLSEHLKKLKMSNPFSPYAEAEREAILEAVKAREGYQEDDFPIDFGWKPEVFIFGKRRGIRAK